MIETIENIVIWLKQDASIFASLGNRIYIWQPIDEQKLMYLTINQITQTQNIIANNITRLEFRYIGDNLSQLSTIEGLVTKYIVNNHTAMWFFNVEISWATNGYDDKKRPVLIRDLIFYKVTQF